MYKYTVFLFYSFLSLSPPSLFPSLYLAILSPLMTLLLTTKPFQKLNLLHSDVAWLRTGDI